MKSQISLRPGVAVELPQDWVPSMEKLYRRCADLANTPPVPNEPDLLWRERGEALLEAYRWLYLIAAKIENAGRKEANAEMPSKDPIADSLKTIARCLSEVTVQSRTGNFIRIRQ